VFVSNGITRTFTTSPYQYFDKYDRPDIIPSNQSDIIITPRKSQPEVSFRSQSWVTYI
jgi:hypothetical protein